MANFWLGYWANGVSPFGKFAKWIWQKRRTYTNNNNTTYIRRHLRPRYDEEREPQNPFGKFAGPIPTIYINIYGDITSPIYGRSGKRISERMRVDQRGERKDRWAG